MKYGKFAMVAAFAVLLVVSAGAVAAQKHQKKKCPSGHHRNGTKCVKNRTNAARNPGSQSTPAPAGPTGATGAPGAQGPVGNQGPTGQTGPTGASNVKLVNNLDGSQGWFTTAGDEAELAVPVPTLTPNGVQTAFDTGTQYASLRSTVLAGKTFGQLSRVSYSAGYTQTSDAHGGTPYFRVFFNGDYACGGNEEKRIVYTANTQEVNLSNSGDYRAFDVTAGTIRYDDDPGEDEADSTYTWDEAQEVFGAEMICQIAVSMGDGGGYTAGATTDVGSISLEAEGSPLTIYNFGS